MTPYHQEPGVTLYNGDAAEVLPAVLEPAGGELGCLVYDPPYDEVPDLDLPAAASLLVFTDPRNAGDAFAKHGPPAWVFVWDCMNTWQTSPSAPVQQAKLCLWYGDAYNRELSTWGQAPPRRDNPTTKQRPLNGRRLTDVWRESLRWLHTPGTPGGAVRHRDRAGLDAYKHAKPVGWVGSLIAATAGPGLVVDPFAGSGTTLVACRRLGLECVGIELNELACEAAVERLSQAILPLTDDEHEQPDLPS